MSTQNETVEKVLEPVNFAPSPDFRWLCDELFVKLDEASHRKEALHKPLGVTYYDIISNFIKLWRVTVGDDIYPALVLALPYRDRRIYNIKDFTLIKAVCAYLRLPKHSFTEKRLLEWKHRAGRNVRLSSFCIREIEKRKSESKDRDKITIDKLNELLDTLMFERSNSGRGFKNLAESEVFKYCLENMSHIELTYFFDILLKSRIIGGQEHKILNSWHPDAVDYLSVVSDLKMVTRRLWNPNDRLGNDDMNIKIGMPYSPQLARKLSISYDRICKKLEYNFYIEEKMDGERLQLHFMNYGDKIKYFSRRGTDYTYLYGENIKSGAISCHLNLDNNVRDCILDGEMITFDSNKNIVLPFGLVKSSAIERLTKEGLTSKGYHPLFMVFDVVLLNGISLVDIPLKQRKEYLSSILKPEQQFVEMIPFTAASNAESIKKSLEKAIEKGSEGIILKNPNSRYTVGNRNDGWIKIKPEYLENFGENMDLVVLGRDPGKKSSLMCGLAVTEEETQNDSRKEIVLIDSIGEEAVEERNSDNIPVASNILEKRTRIIKFISFCSVANGISNEEFKEIDRRTHGLWKRCDDNPPPADLIEFGTKVPIEWINPKKSIVIEVKARSVSNTDAEGKRFKTGCTLFGAYCRRIRYDKDWTSCYTLKEFEYERNKKISNSGQMTHSIARNKRKRKNYTSSLSDNLLPTNIETTSQIFFGLYFYVLSDYFDDLQSKRISKNNLKSLILNNSGIIIHNVIAKHYRNNQLRIISGKCTNECKSLIDRRYDILSPRWILDCIESGKLLSLEPNHCFEVSDKLRELSETRIDKFGDSYQSTITIPKFNQILMKDNLLKDEKIEELDIVIDKRIPYFLFYGRKAYIPEKTFNSKDGCDIKTKMELYGGVIVSSIYDSNIVIFPSMCQKNQNTTLMEIRKTIASMVRRSNEVPHIPPIVTAIWLEDSIKECIQVPEENYPVTEC